MLFFLAAPGVVAGLVPWWLTGYRLNASAPWLLGLRFGAGGLLLLAGLAVLVRAFGRFVLEGRGTPAPIAPTEVLVVGGDYRYVRNPMYVAVIACILGQAVILGSLALLGYAVAVWLAMAAFVHWYEEPVLGATVRVCLRELPQRRAGLDPSCSPVAPGGVAGDLAPNRRWPIRARAGTIYSQVL